MFAAADFQDAGRDRRLRRIAQAEPAFSDQFSANIGAGYRDQFGVEAFKVVAGADYTLVPGFVIGPEVVYEDVTGVGDSITAASASSVTSDLLTEV